MNKHTVKEHVLGDFHHTFMQLLDYLEKCGERIVKTSIHLGYCTYSAKVWTEKGPVK